MVKNTLKYCKECGKWKNCWYEPDQCKCEDNYKNEREKDTECLREGSTELGQ